VPPSDEPVDTTAAVESTEEPEPPKDIPEGGSLFDL
jgi:hypothetical protein